MPLSAPLAAPSSSSSSSSSLRHVLVVGGTGFVGSAICRSALRHGLAVSALSRSGCSPYEGSGVRDERQLEWTRRVRWCKADLLGAASGWSEQLLPRAASSDSAGPAGLPPVDAVVSCVGGFGSVDYMRRVNGDANIAAFDAAARCPQVRRVGFISAFHYQLPALMQRGYMEGKLAAEDRLAALFPASRAAAAGDPGMGRAAVVSQTGVIYGSRYLRSLGVHLPLQLLFAPLGLVTDNSLVRAIRQAPFIGPLLTPALLPPVSVDALSDAMIERLMDESLSPGVHALSVDDIRQRQSS